MGGITLDDMMAAGALLEGHFKLSSGRHSSRYLQCALYLADPARAEAAGRQLAARLKNAAAQLVVAPALGGVIIGHEVARALADVPFFFTERADGVMTLRRGFRIEPGCRVLVVEDVVTTGGSTRETMQVARAAGAQVVAAVAIVDRSGGTAALDVPLHALLDLALPTYDPAACPLCASGAPIQKPGSRQVAVGHDQ